MKEVVKQLDNKNFHIHVWKYNSENPNFKEWGDTGYEDLNKELDKLTAEVYKESSEKEKNNLIEKVFNIIRSRNIFPGTYYYTHKDILDEIKECKRKILPKFDGISLTKRPTTGNLLMKFLFPNFFLIVCKGQENNIMYSRFYDDHKLKRAIKLRFEFAHTPKESPKSYNIYRSLELIGGETGTNYLPLRARMLLEYFLPKGGNYLDFSCGFGSRLLGSQAANVNGKINYYGLEPNSETYFHLNELKNYIQEAYQNNTGEIHLFERGSEVILPNEILNKMDFVFSCPPYFSLEKYSNENTQCMIKYPSLEQWLNGYVYFTIANLYLALKRNCYCAVEIADFKINNEEVHFVDKWIELSQGIGFEYIKAIPIKLGRKRPNNKEGSKQYIPKEECIYLFKKH